jgi:hypothetical protein
VFVKVVSGRPTLLVIVRWNFLVDSSAVPVEVFFKFGFVTPYVVVGLYAAYMQFVSKGGGSFSVYPVVFSCTFVGEWVVCNIE